MQKNRGFIQVLGPIVALLAIMVGGYIYYQQNYTKTTPIPIIDTTGNSDENTFDTNYQPIGGTYVDTDSTVVEGDNKIITVPVKPTLTNIGFKSASDLRGIYSIKYPANWFIINNDFDHIFLSERADTLNTNKMTIREIQNWPKSISSKEASLNKDFGGKLEFKEEKFQSLDGFLVEKFTTYNPDSKGGILVYYLISLGKFSSSDDYPFVLEIEMNGNTNNTTWINDVENVVKSIKIDKNRFESLKAQDAAGELEAKVKNYMFIFSRQGVNYPQTNTVRYSENFYGDFCDGDSSDPFSASAQVEKARQLLGNTKVSCVTKLNEYAFSAILPNGTIICVDKTGTFDNAKALNTGPACIK